MFLKQKPGIFLVIILVVTLFTKLQASHGMALVNPVITVGPTCVTITASSNAATCGGGPYWLQAEIRCTANQLTGTPPATMQTQLLNWAGPGVTFNQFPWFNSLLNVPNYTFPSWPDQCVLEPYHPVVICYAGLCPGQTYFVAAREWVSGTNSVGPWTAPLAFTVPGIFVPLSFNISANPTIFCAPGNSTLTISNVAGGCGQTTYTWLPTNQTSSSIVVAPVVTTNYTAVVSTPCNTLQQTVQVTVVPVVSAAFTPLNSTGCINTPIQFNHTGTAGVSHTWAVTPAANTTLATSSSTNPVITFSVAGVYTISHTVAIGSCTNVVSTNITISGLPPAFTIPSATQCIQGNSFSFNAVNTGGTHTYAFNPSAGAPATGNVPNYVGSFTQPGTYTVTHTINNNGCITSTTGVVVVNASPAAVLNFTNAFCGQNNGIIVINNTSPPGQFITSTTHNGNPIGTQTLTGLSPGTHTIVLTNNFGCTFTVTQVIGNTPGITALATTFTNASCAVNNGIIVVGAVTGGTPTYSFNINNGAYSTNTTFANLGAGTYTIGVLDVNGCTFTKTISIVNTIPPSNMTFTMSPTACSANTGILGITGVTGGVAPFTFSINSVATGSVSGSLAAGPYTLTVKDAAGCTFSIVATVTTVVGPSAASVSTTPAACGNSNGSATVTSVTGGVGPYQYNFNSTSFSTNSFVINQLAGPKSVVIMDANGCTFTVNFTIGNTGSPVSAVSSISNVSCFGGANGSFTLNTVGGTPNYNYTLTPGNITSGFGFYTNLTAQNYTVNVMDAMGCVTTVTLNISQPSPLTSTLSSMPPSCFGGNNGTITALAGGGTGPYQYNINAGPNQTSNTFTTNISATVYNITVVDSKGCTLTKTVQVFNPTPVTLTLSSQNSNCTAFNGVASVTASGGAGGYTYTWSPTGGNNAQTFGVAAGVYTVNVKDQNGCLATGQVQVFATPGGTATIVQNNPVTCNGFNNGSAMASFAGGFTAPITYSWSNTQLGPNATNLAPGTYTVYLTDVNGCKSNTTVTITQPAVLNFAVNGSSVLCNNGSSGSATVSAITGGNPGYIFLWTPGGSTLSTAAGLSAGVYSVTVTDTKGCNLTKTVTITQPTSVTVVSFTTTANCNQANGSASVSASGGIGPYTYTWSTSVIGPVLNNVSAGTYTVAVKDANGCIYPGAATVPNASGPAIAVTSQTNVSCFGGNNAAATSTANGGTPPYVYSWSNAQMTPMATNLSAGVYTVSVTDNVGCVASASVLITQPPALTLNVTGNNPLCFGATNGNANAGVLGGTPGYNYTWTPNPGTGQGSATPGNMGAGVYLVTVMDSKGCIINGSVQLNNPPQLLASVSKTNVTCFNACNGTAVGSTTNNAGPVSYFYVGGPSALATQSVSGLCIGGYTMTATDANNCIAQVTFTITQPPALVATISAVGSVSCSGGNNGFATINASGGTPGYLYNWSNSQTNPTATNLSAGVYTYTVTDAQGCAATGNVNINQPAGLTTTVTSSNVTCFNANNGTGNVAYSGGTGIPTFLWFPSLNVTPTANNLGPGVHTVVVTDGNGCQQTKTISITQPTQLNGTILGIVSTNCGQANGSASVAASGGAGGYSYLWSGSPTYTNPGLTGVVAGPYTVIVTDANGCQTATIANIPNIAGPTIANTFSTHVDCFGNANGASTVVASVLVPPMTYLWSFAAQTTSVVTNLPAGLHSITVFDGAGCVASANIQINQPPQLVSAIGTPTHSSCFLSFNGQAPAFVNGGTPGYTYTWTPSAQSSSMLTNAGAGTYTCFIMDNNGCTTSSSVTLTQPSQLIINTNTVINVSCNGGSNGLINTNIVGGTPFYNISWASTSTVTPPSNQVATNLPAGTYTMSVVDSKGCPTNSVYTLTQPAALSIVSTATSPATCGNANGSATVVITGGSSPYAYNWNTPSPQNTNVAVNLNGGIWTLTSTDSKGCTITSTVSIFTPALPSMTMGFTPPVCFGQPNGSVWMTPTGNSPFTYNWTPISSTTGTNTGITAAVYSGTVTDSYGCKVFGVINVTQPNILILNGSGPDTICYGRFIQIYGAAGGGTTPYTYNWSTPGSVITATTGGPHMVTPTISSVYTVAVTDANGCINGPIYLNVEVRPQLLATGFSVTKCAKDSVILTNNITSPGNGGPYTFKWMPTNQSTPDILVVANSSNNPRIDSLSITDGCTIPGAMAYYTVNVNPLPVASFSSTERKGCMPWTVRFQALSDNPTSDTYVWNFGTGGESNGTTPFQVITYPQDGMYPVYLQVTNQFGCKSDTAYANYVEVWPLPTANFDAAPQTVTLLNPTVTFTNMSIDAVSYYWEFSDYTSGANSTTVVHPTHTYQYLGIYPTWLVAINQFGCKDTIKKNIEVLNDVGIYIPNAFTPDNNGLNESFFPQGYGIKDEDKYKLEIFDRWGELIYSSDNLHRGWDGRVKGTDKIAEEGVYIYKILITDLQGYKKYFVGHVTVVRQN
jgi:gliding motility-associated-like protein